LGAFQSDRLFSSTIAWVDHQMTLSTFERGLQREGDFVDDFSPVVGPSDRASDLVVFESGPECHYIELASVLNEGGFGVISPACGA
jgi:hypothetical protein